MLRILGLLLLLAGLALAQEAEDDSGIEVDSGPTGPEEPASDPAKGPQKERTTAFPAREPGKKVETVEIKRKNYSFTVPADWVLHDEEKADVELSFELLLPGSSKHGSLQLRRRENAADPRSLPYYQAEWFRKEKPDYKVEVLAKPCPRVVLRNESGGTEWVNAHFGLSVRNNVFTLEIWCAAADFPQAETDLIATVRSFKAEVEIWPPIPKGYETSEEGIWLVARAPEATASIAPLVRALKEAEKRFRREHGPLPKGDAPLVVLVHASKAQGAKLDPAVGESKIDFHSDAWARRLFAIPFVKDDVAQESMLAGEATDLLFVAKYGDWKPRWISLGENILAAAEVRTGKPLPNLDEGYLNWYAAIRFHKISDFDALRDGDPDAWTHESFFYVAALREGKYRKQYKAFLEDFAETGDGQGAYERQLAQIDPDELIAATNRYVTTRIKEEKRKHEHDPK
ncbi:MAG TPA: hypothetical protein VFY93_13505 [Planctomycetota bacterium]|nr:hypothetical protein [Planctomycetota bacterium]